MLAASDSTSTEFLGLVPHPSSLVFIDDRVENYESLRAGVPDDVRVVVLDRQQNGIEQITAELQKYATSHEKVEAVYILSHGSSGNLQLGNTSLNLETIGGYKSHLQKWHTALSPTADIMLYGCAVASGSGRNLIQQLHRLTKADIAASLNPTGQDYDWDLEFQSGKIEASLPVKADVLKSYSGTLGTLTVSNNNDSGPGSLREALATAKSGDTIVFEPSLTSQTITLTSGQLVIDKSLILDGKSAPDLTISGNQASRVFYIAGSIDVTLRNLIIANGKVGNDPVQETSAGGGIQTGGSNILTLENCQINQNVAGFGGGLHTGFRSKTTVINCKFDGNDGSLGANTERGGGAIATKSGSILTVKDSEFTNNVGGYGGAINNLLSELTVENSKFLNNKSNQSAGGAIYVDGASELIDDNVGGTVTIRNSLFDGNTGTGEGGAAFLFGYQLDKITLEDSSFINNKAIQYPQGGGGSAGGVRHGNVDLTVNNCTFANNTAEDNGGGLWVGEEGNVIITNSTFSGNKAKGQGGAITIANGNAFTTQILNTTIADNSAEEYGGAIAAFDQQPISVKNSIFYNNTAGNPFKVKQQTTKELIDSGNNLQFPAKLTASDPNDNNVTAKIAIADPKLGPLQDNGGDRLTHALLEGSPAIDGGAASPELTRDQRGATRSDGKIDIGAFEFGATLPTPSTSTTPVTTPVPSPAVTPTLTAGTSVPAPPPEIEDTSCLCDRIPTPDFKLGRIAFNIPDKTFNCTDSNDFLTGDSANNAMMGFSGQDTLIGMDGSDNIYAGEGDDWLLGNERHDCIDGDGGNDLIFGGKDEDALLGNLGNDTLLGDLGRDTLLGGEGNDWVVGNEDSDSLQGDSGNDLLMAGKGRDLVLGGDGNDKLLGNLDNDTLIGNFGADSLDGGSGSDFIDGGFENDVLLGGEDNDLLKGEDGNDFLTGDTGDDTLCGGSGQDLLYGNEGADTLDGCSNNDFLYGGAGNDSLIGGGGHDLLSGSFGDDTLIGSTGNDIFVLSLEGGIETIVDLKKGQDLIGLSAGITFSQLAINAGVNQPDSSSITFITLASNGQILATLKGVTASSLKSEDFTEVVV